MSVKAVKAALRKLGRAMRANDANAFDNALDEAIEELEDVKDGEGGEDPDTIEVHNHIPDAHDTSMGELPPKDPPGFDRRSHDEEAPPWAKQMQEDFRRMTDSVGALEKWAKEEGMEPEHQEDRRHDDRRHDDRRHDDRRHDDRRHDDRSDGGGLENLGEHAEHGGDHEDPSLEMEGDRRHDDRRHDDRRHDDRRPRDRRHDDEANKAILGELEFEAPPGTGDRARRATDSALLADAFQQALSNAEVLAPGISLPTFDAKAPPVRTMRAIDTLRRDAIDLAYNKAETRGLISQAMGGRTVDSKTMRMGQVRVLFNAAAAMAATGNNNRATDRTTDFNGSRNNQAAGIGSLAQLNQRNREFYAGNKK